MQATAKTRSDCLVCGASLNPSRIRGLLECSQCHFITADLRLRPEELASLYSEKYFNGEEYANYLNDARVAEKSFRVRLKKLLQFIPDAKSKDLFEVGCAYGLFLKLAAERFRHVSGIDISSHAISYAQSVLHLDVQCGDLLSAKVPERIDVACLWDTIEHLGEPGEYIAKLSAHMPRGSWLALTTGDIESRMARWRGAKWRQIHPPTHLHYFSRRTLAVLLEQHGFTVRYSGYDGMYRSLETMSYILFVLKNKREYVHRALKSVGVLRRDLYLNLGDIIFLIAEKTGDQALPKTHSAVLS